MVLKVSISERAYDVRIAAMAALKLTLNNHIMKITSSTSYHKSHIIICQIQAQIL